jgi:glycosyltransferase involved in cell wall biosynthesis
MTARKKYNLVVFSHLRWHSVFQRPQHIVSRLAKDATVLFVEEPDKGTDSLESSATLENINHNLDVLTPHLEWEGWKAMCEKYIPILEEFVENIEDSVIWFYSPFYVHILNYIKPGVIVYDCMDELSAFKNASPNLPGYEKDLLQKAHIVFTGGKSLFEEKVKHHPNVYCFPSSVDREHFERASIASTELPGEFSDLKKPVIGFYGVIDERIDFTLLKSVAEKLSWCTFLMIGPLAKIEEEDLAKAENIVYPGKRHYDELPSYLKGVDVAMMPFAINESTRFISPTKTLEFMGAGKPIVSTAIYDVVRDYSDCVFVANNDTQFIEGIMKFIEESDEEKMDRLKKYDTILSNTSWDRTVEEMKKHIDEQLDILKKRTIVL